MSFNNYKTSTLVKIERNLLKGLDLVAKSIDDGTFATVGEKGKAPPSQSGHLTLAILAQIGQILDKRGVTRG